tara:strand:- start:7005 stop:10142 length:3138 start_codon:yes stop_codon:yes gene_type:complete
MKIVHIADIHWRGLSRHKEYTKSFESFFEQCREISPDVIYVGGDIVHSKTQGISPELIDRLSWWFTSMAEICPVHVILGNHDGLILNKDRQDAISPIISALDNKNIHLYKKSGVYSTGVDGYNWCVFSCFDEEGWDIVRPIENEINIALFHGAVWGSTTDIDWEIDGDVTVDLFENFDFALLGDIHKKQFLNNSKTIAYSGSTIQQNYGEDPGKGFLLWEIEDKDKFKCTFHTIEHSCEFVTIDWMGDVSRTLEESLKYKKGSRFRIRSKSLITHADTQEISYRLRTDMNAEEVVFKNENQFDVSSYGQGSESGEINLRDISSHSLLLDDFFKNHNLTDEEVGDIKDLAEKYFSIANSGDEVLRNTRWQIENINFNNLFSYGENNIIDFSKNTGITGIFGKNTRGKSSIVGSLMYCLFNTTDRGPVKNLHIINSRKNFCDASIDIKLNGEFFRISRGTVKHTTRKGETYASTSLGLSKISKNGEVEEDLTEEQRRETEKILRKLIGTSDDFLMTSLSSQGGMNRFISEGSTNRKAILTKFLDLEIFEKMNDLCKNDSSTIRALSRSIKKEDWETKIEEESSFLERDEKSLQSLGNSLEKFREILNNLKIEKSNNAQINSEYFTEDQINSQKEKIKESRKKIDMINISVDNISKSIDEDSEKFKKIESVCNSISIEELKLQRDAQISLEKNAISLLNTMEKASLELKRLNESAKKLDRVPCGTKYPTCMFIKSSHENKDKIENQGEIVKEAKANLEECQKSLKIVNKINPKERIEKYEALFLRMKELSGTIGISSAQLEIEIERRERESFIYRDLKSEMEKMSLLLVEDKDNPFLKIDGKIKKAMKKIANLEAEKTMKIEEITKRKIKIQSLEDDKEKYDQIKRQMRIYDLFLQAISKKGIPARIMMSRLPIINREISKILQGVVDFTVLLEADQNTNSMEIYIDYGDSKRVIELASGMEKMISSLAIRVALINTSSLTKTNMMIIDEGFGSLDANNLEACTRLLESLKKWFRNILIISHVDAVKDCVDNSVEIVKKGKDSHVRFM